MQVQFIGICCAGKRQWILGDTGSDVPDHTCRCKEGEVVDIDLIFRMVLPYVPV